MDIVNEETKSGGRYVAKVDGYEAEMTYSRQSPEVIVVDHTGVPEPMRGKGIAQSLAVYAVEEARKGGWKIVPLCSYLKAEAERHPDWQDVIK
jgi:predicted GNAT family acetyltransferase